MLNCLGLMMASYSDLLIANYLVLYLDLQMETHSGFMKTLCWVLQVAISLVLIMSLMRFNYLVTHLDQMMSLY